MTIPKTPKQNWIAQRIYRTLVKTVTSILSDAKLPHKFWAEALYTAVYLCIRSQTKAVKHKMPFEALKGEKPTVKHLCIFGYTEVQWLSAEAKGHLARHHCIHGNGHGTMAMNPHKLCRSIPEFHVPCSSWCKARVISTSSTKTTEVQRNQFTRFGIPEQLVIDNVCKFASEGFQAFIKVNGIWTCWSLTSTGRWWAINMSRVCSHACVQGWVAMQLKVEHLVISRHLKNSGQVKQSKLSLEMFLGDIF